MQLLKNYKVMNIDIKSILETGERVTLECKKAQHSVPNSLWDTYPAFANTHKETSVLVSL